MKSSERPLRGDAHRNRSHLSQVILGAQDGLVNVVGVVLGVAAATTNTRVVLAAGLAAAFAESVSMAAVAFTTARADDALYRSELQREQRHIRAIPELEKNEIRDLYRQKGLSGELLEQVVNAITSDPAVWVAVMMTEELRLAPVDRAAAARGAWTVGLASLVGSLIPLAPFLLLQARLAAIGAVACAALTLFALGAYKAIVTVGRWWWSGLELAAIGLMAALIGYEIGALFGA
jgi:VIT1/CCC1 family predicted Fe2+/Mn2+ transporter